MKKSLFRRSLVGISLALAGATAVLAPSSSMANGAPTGSTTTTVHETCSNGWCIEVTETITTGTDSNGQPIWTRTITVKHYPDRRLEP